MRSDDIGRMEGALKQPRKSLLVFDPSNGGHHAGYVLHFLKYACSQAGDGTIYLAVPPAMMSEGSEVYGAAHESCSFDVRPVSLDPELFERFQGGGSLTRRAWLQWRLMQNAIARTEPDHCLAMYVDHLLLPLAVGLSPGCGLSGIYFRPTFHYSSFQAYRPTIRDQVRSLRQKFTLKLALRSRSLQYLFCLDPFVPPIINRMAGGMKAKFLPELVSGQVSSSSGKPASIGKVASEKGRVVFLLFGAISERKGVFQLLEACSMLSPQTAMQTTVLVVGRVAPDIADCLEARVKDLRNSTETKIVVLDKRILERNIQAIFDASDVILTTYQQHVGMSGILARAAAVGKPLLSSDYGLLGELVRTENLGMTIDSSRPEEIAKAMSDIVKNKRVSGFDLGAARGFAARNSSDAFARILYDTVTGGPPVAQGGP